MILLISRASTAFAVLIGAAVAMANESAGDIPYPTFKKGSGTWTYEQVSLAGGRRQVSRPMLSVGYRNGKSVTFLVQSASGVATLAQPMFAINDEACGVDIVGGIAVLAGHSCSTPLVAGESWTGKHESRGMATAFTNTYIGPEDVTVPAGTFTAYKIQSRQVFSYSDVGKASQSSLTTYWYVPQIRGMARVERHLFDEKGSETLVMTEEMTAHTER